MSDEFPGLTSKERALLAVLTSTPPGQAASLPALLSAAWEVAPDARPSQAQRRTLAVHICWLRAKIAPHRIECVRPEGGYRFIRAA